MDVTGVKNDQQEAWKTNSKEMVRDVFYSISCHVLVEKRVVSALGVAVRIKSYDISSHGAIQAFNSPIRQDLF